jgi:hypothetical protein
LFSYKSKTTLVVLLEQSIFYNGVRVAEEQRRIQNVEIVKMEDVEKGLLHDTGMLLGIALAVAHHPFHAFPNGQPVKSNTQQQWVGRVSLGVAQLVRYCFKIVISITTV